MVDAASGDGRDFTTGGALPDGGFAVGCRRDPRRQTPLAFTTRAANSTAQTQRDTRRAGIPFAVWIGTGRGVATVGISSVTAAQVVP